MATKLETRSPPRRWLKFERGFQGEIITPKHPAYPDARKVWNGMIDRRPLLIARPGDPADVAAVVRFAREHQVELAIRGGGHNVAGSGVCDGGIVCDLSAVASRGRRSDATAPRAPRAGRRGQTSIARLIQSAWQRPGEWSPAPESAGSHWGEASAG